MARLSKVDRLPAEIREEIGRLREQGRTIDEILSHLRSLGVEEISRSGLGRHVQDIDAIGEEIRRSRAVAEGLVERLGEGREDRTARLNIELMQSLLLRMAAAEARKAEISLSPQEAMFFTRALANLSGAAKADSERELRQRRELAKEMAERLEREVSEAGGAVTPERLRQVVRQAYGL